MTIKSTLRLRTETAAFWAGFGTSRLRSRDRFSRPEIVAHFLPATGFRAAVLEPVPIHSVRPGRIGIVAARPTSESSSAPDRIHAGHFLQAGSKLEAAP